MVIGMTEEQVEKLLVHINNTWASKGCPMCNDNNWSVVGVQSIALQEDESIIKIGGPSVPCAVIGCRHCGNIVLVNLIIANVYER